MAKRIDITERIKEQIRAVAGDDIDYDKIAVYEAEAASTRAITQKRTSYHGATMTESFLREMANWLPDNPVTLQVMHDDHFLPVGKVFYAEVFTAAEGHHNLNALFYLEKDSEHVSKIDLAIIDEVSVGALPKHAYCSECGFDFMDNPHYMWWGECENEHKIGENGTHLRLTKLDTWNELSLVNRGASSKPKILGSAKQRLSKEEYTRLAASGSSPEGLYLFATATPQDSNQNLDNKERPMDPKLLELSAANGKLEAEKETLATKLQLADKNQAEQKTLIDTLTEENQQLKANGTNEKVQQLEADLDEAQKLTASALSTLKPQYCLACTAADIEPKEDATLAEMVTTINEASVKLVLVPRTQQTKDTNVDDVEASTALNASRNQHFVLSNS